MSTSTELKAQIKRLLVENLMLQIRPEEIGDDQPLFGPDGLGLDSVDALQLVVALEKNHGLKLSDAEVARNVIATKAMSSVYSIKSWPCSSCQSRFIMFNIVISLCSEIHESFSFVTLEKRSVTKSSTAAQPGSMISLVVGK